MAKDFWENDAPANDAPAAGGGDDFWSADKLDARQDLPDGMTPSTAGGGRGSVNPSMGLADAQPSRAQRIAEMDTLTDPTSPYFTQPTSKPRSSVLEGVTMPELPFDAQEAERLSNRAYAERTPIPGTPRRELPTMRASTGPAPIPRATGLGESLQESSLPVRALAKAGAGIVQGVGGVSRAVGDVTGMDGLARGGTETAKQAEQFQQGMGTISAPEGFGPKSPVPYLADMAEGAGASLAQSAAMAAAFGPGAVIPLMSIQSAGQEYDKARKQGLDPAAALAGAIPKGIFEAVGEKFTGLDKVAGAMGTLLQKGTSDMAKRTAGEVLIRAGIREIPGEMITYLGQTGVDLLPGIGLKQDLTMGQFLDGMRDTVVQAGMMGGAMGGAGAITSRTGTDQPAPQDSAEAMAKSKGFLVREGQIKRLRDAGETQTADLLQQKHDRATATESVDGELQRMPGTPEFQTSYRQMRTAGVKPAEAAARSAVTVSYQGLAATAGIPEKAAAAALEKAATLPLDQVPGFFAKFTAGLAKRGLVLPFDGMDNMTAALEAARDDAIEAAMGAAYQPAPEVRQAMDDVMALEAAQDQPLNANDPEVLDAEPALAPAALDASPAPFAAAPELPSADGAQPGAADAAQLAPGAVAAPGEDQSVAGARAVEGDGVNRAAAAAAGIATSDAQDAAEKLRFAEFAEAHSGKDVNEIRMALVQSEFGPKLATNELSQISDAISLSGGDVASYARNNAAPKKETSPQDALKNRIRMQKLRVEQADAASSSARDVDQFGLSVDNGPKKQAAAEKARKARSDLAAMEGELAGTSKASTAVATPSPSSELQTGDAGRRAEILKSLDGTVGSTRAVNLSYKIENRQQKLRTQLAYPNINKQDQQEAVARLEQEIGDYQAILPAAEQADQRDMRSGISRTMLSGAKAELDVSVANGDMSQQEARDAIEKARATGNAADASESIFSAVDAKATLNPDGTLNIKGDPAAIKAQLAGAGLTGIPMKGGMQVGRKQAAQAQRVFEPKEPIAQASPAPSATESIAQDAAPAPNKQESQPTYAKGAVVETPVAALALSRDVPQFKSDAGANGVTQGSKLEGKYDRAMAAPIQVWQRKDGRMEVISGRHRLDLAQRSGETTIPSQIHREADGFDADMARVLDIELNVKDGRGKVKDYVAYFKEIKPTAEQARADGLLNTALGRQAYTVADSGSETLIASHANNAISDEAAVSIAQNAPGNEALQNLGMQQVASGKTINHAVNVMRAARAAGFEGGSSGDMFGFDDSFAKEAEAIAKEASRQQSALRQQLAAVRGASKRPELAAKGGVSIKNLKATQAKIAEMESQLVALDGFATNPEVYRQLRVDAGLASQGAAAPVQAAQEEDAPASVDSDSEGLFGDAPEILTAPTQQEVLDQQDRAEKAERAATAKRRADDELDRRERVRKDIAKASEAAADTFTLGGDAEQNLSGQGGMFDEPAPAPAKPATQTDTPAFKQWFKGSNVVDAAGQPLAMYHGTSASEKGDAFASFDTYASSYGLMGMGGYFTADPAVASSYTTKGKGTTPTVYKTFLSIRNPLDMDAKADPAAWKKQFDGAEAYHEGGTTNESWYRAAESSLSDEGLPMYEGAEIMQDGLRAMGFDGITHIGGGRVKADGVKHRVYIAFEPEQAKSATGNNGNFDQADPRMAFARAAKAEPKVENLVTLHNLTAENLLHAAGMGGIAVPSIGITKVESAFGGFGDITLIAPKGMIDPASGTPVFDRDAYTARHPGMNFKKVQSGKADVFYAKFKAIADEVGADGRAFQSQLWEAMTGSNASPDKVQTEFRHYAAPRLMYAREVSGKKITIPMRDVPVDFAWAADKQFAKTFAGLSDTLENYASRDVEASPELLALSKAAREAIGRRVDKMGATSTLERDDLTEALAVSWGSDGKWATDSQGVMPWTMIGKLRTSMRDAGKKEVDNQKLGSLLDKAVPKDDAGYTQWAQAQIKPLFAPPTITLRGKEVEPTLANVVEAMTIGGVAGSEKTMTSGPGKVAAQLGKRFKSLAEIQAARDQIVSEADETLAKKSTDALLTQYRDRALGFYTETDWRGQIDTWGGMDAAMDALVLAGKNTLTDGNIRTSLQRRGFKGMDQETIDLARQVIDALRNSSTNYFEAKPQRAVRLNEFTGAVVPKGTSKEVLDVLAANGIEVLGYNKALDGSKLKALEKLARTLHKKQGDVLFARDAAGGEASSAAVQKVQQQADELSAKWKNGPTVKVVATPADLPVPAPSDARGLIHKGTAYIVASNNPTRNWVARTLAHEAIGHHGLWQILGEEGAKRFARNVKLAIVSGNKPLNAISAKVRRLYVDDKGRFNLSAKQESDEIAAFVVEDAVDPVTGQFKPGYGFVKEVYAKLAAWLRDTMGIKVPFTMVELQGMLVSAMRGLESGKRLEGGGQSVALSDSDIAQQFILPARRLVEQGKVSNNNRGMMFSRGAKQSIPTPDIPKKLSQAQFEDILQDIDIYGPAKDEDSLRALRSIFLKLKSAGVDFIDMYHVTDADLVDFDDDGVTGFAVDNTGKSSGNLRAASVYGFLDPDDIANGYDGVLGAKSETPNVIHIKLPVGNILNLRWDSNFNVSFGTYSGIRLVGNVKKEWIAGAYRYDISKKSVVSSEFPGGSSQSDGSNTPVFSRTGGAFARGIPTPGPGLFQPTAWSAPDPTRTDRIIYELQDGRVDLRRVQQAIAKSGQQIAEKWDARLAETLYPGRVAHRSQTFLEIEAKPLLEAMTRNNVPMNELADYLHARGAEERNKQIAKVNPKMPDGGAGTNSEGTLLTTQAARDYLANLRPARKVVLDAMAKRVDAITAGTRRLLVAEGLEKQETIDAWEGAYKNYVPMFRDEAESAMPPHPQGSGFAVKGSASRRATGSTKEVTNILAHVLMQREAAITRAEKNRVALALYGQALSHPNPAFWTTIKPSMSNAQISAELQAMGVDPMTAQVGMQGVPTIRTVDKATGTVVNRANPMYQTMPGAIPLKVNGEDRVLMLNVTGVRGLRLAESLKNLDGLTNLDLAGNIIGKSTRWLAAVNTQYNPAFGFTNLTRDVLGGVINLGSTELRGHALKVLAKTPIAILGIARELATGKQAGKWGRLYVQFQADGGQTGFKDNFREPNDRAKAIEKELSNMGGSVMARASRTAHLMLDLLDGFNTSLENAVRLSAYSEALDNGMSRANAARLGRELTVDFNRKGRAGREVGPLYAFFNASVQGAARTIEALKGPTGRKIIAGGLSLGMVQALMLAAAGYDDDEIPEFVKTRALIIPLPGEEKTYISIPYPLGLHVIPNTARVLTELTLSGGKDIGKRSMAAIGEIAGAFNPLGGGNIFTADGALKTAAPTLVDPLIEIGFNRNFAGGKIEKEGYGGESDNRPGVARTKESTQRSTTGQVYMGISKAINTMTGGTDYEKGLASPTPERVRYLAQTVGGGVLREIEKTVNASTASARGEKVKMSQIPVAGRFYGEVDGDQVQMSRYYDSSSKLKTLESSFKAMVKAGDADAARKFLDEHPELVMARTAAAVQQKVAALNKLAVQTVSDPAMMKEIDAARVANMVALNQALKAQEDAAGRPTLGRQLREAVVSRGKDAVAAP